MDQVEELGKYKDLLDSGAITEEEFTQMKQKLLGLKTDEEKEAEREAERAKALKEIDAMREAEKKKAEEEERRKQEDQEKAERKKREEQEKAEAEQREQEIQASKEKAAKAYSEEKAKEKARLDAAQEHEDALKAEKAQKAQDTAKNAGNVVKNIVLWIAVVILLFLGIPFITMLPNVFYFVSGIICFVLAVMACPIITSRTKKIPALSGYYRFKIPIVIVLVVLLLVMLVLAQ